MIVSHKAVDSPNGYIIGPDDLVVVTGATGFIGSPLVQSLLRHGFRNVRAFARPSSDLTRLEAVADPYRSVARVEVIRGNLLSREDCLAATRDAKVVFHLAMGGDKSFAGSFMNTVITTRNLVESTLQHGCLQRFVNVSSFAVYSNRQRSPLNESSPVEKDVRQIGDAYSYAKLKQDELVAGYGEEFGIPYVIVRPGSVFGPGKTAVTGRVGVDTFGIFLHLGGSNRIPLTYVDNCADAITLAGIVAGVDKEIFNVVDDDVPTSRDFLRMYKRHVRRFPSIYVPRSLSYALCGLWEKYSDWSHGQLPPAFNRRRWRAEWKKTGYENHKIKTKLGWKPRVPMAEGLLHYFEGCRNKYA